MAFAIIGTMPNGTAEQDFAVAKAAGIIENPPPGALARMAGPMPGGWRVISVWDSRESWNRFRSERLEPAFKATGARPPVFEEWDLQAVRFLAQPTPAGG